MTKKLMTHMVCGYPNLGESQKIFDVLKEKSEYIEIQFPFSDPIADGPVIEKANEVALENGINTEKCFDFCEENIGHPQGVSLQYNVGTSPCGCPNPKILIMTYYNIVLNYGVENFIKKAKSIGIYGFIIPDVPFDEEDGKNFRKLCKKYDIVFTEIVSPLTTEKRLQEIKELNPQLIYAISQNMTTGSKASFGKYFEKYIFNLKSIFLGYPQEVSLQDNVGASPCGCPKIGIGFGVKTKQEVEKINKISDFAIIGSEFIKKYNEGGILELKQYLNKISK